MIPVTISLDDVDSPDGGCTTHFAGLLLAGLHRNGGVELLDYPLLVRLNPGVPWKTRGNAAAVLRLAVYGDPLDVLEYTLALMDEYSRGRMQHAGKSPGIAFYPGLAWTDRRLRWLYRTGLTNIVAIDVAEEAVSRAGGRLYGGRGRVGAAAALAALAPGDDYTFELTAYREPWEWGRPRCIVEGPRALALEARLPACTFNNVTPRGRLAAAPRGPDPVLAGFRGDCPWELPAYAGLLCERPHFWVLYRSNQHTDAHAAPLAGLNAYRTGRVWGVVASRPERLPGSHVVVRVYTGLGPVDAVFYRETGPLRDAASLLEPGDEVVLHGTVRPYAPRGTPTLAVEKMTITRLTAKTIRASPRCPKCGSRMKSLGSGGGYRCPRCGYRDARATATAMPAPRVLGPGTYTPDEGELGHLTMPGWRRPRRAPPARPEADWVLSLIAAPPRHPPVSSGGH